MIDGVSVNGVPSVSVFKLASFQDFLINLSSSELVRKGPYEESRAQYMFAAVKTCSLPISSKSPAFG